MQLSHFRNIHSMAARNLDANWKRPLKKWTCPHILGKAVGLIWCASSCAVHRMDRRTHELCFGCCSSISNVWDQGESGHLDLHENSGVEVSQIGIGAFSWGESFFWEYGKQYNEKDVQEAYKVSFRTNATEVYMERNTPMGSTILCYSRLNILGIPALCLWN